MGPERTRSPYVGPDERLSTVIPKRSSSYAKLVRRVNIVTCHIPWFTESSSQGVARNTPRILCENTYPQLVTQVPAPFTNCSRQVSGYRSVSLQQHVLKQPVHVRVCLGSVSNYLNSYMGPGGPGRRWAQLTTSSLLDRTCMEGVRASLVYPTLCRHCVVLAARDAIVLQPSAPVTVKNVNDSLLVTCSSKGNLMMWLKRGGTEVSAKKGRVHVESKTKDGNSSIYLMFESINKKDEGNYTCKANVDGKEVSASFNLVVIKPISFMDTSVVQSANENENVTVKCEAQGDPEPQIAWSIKGKPPTGPKYKLMGDGLLVVNVTLEDMGEYMCKAFQITSFTSNYQEQNITLKIRHKPIMLDNTSSPIASYGFVTGLVNLTCSVQADPSANFTWTKDSKTLSENLGNITIFNDTNLSTLQVVIHNNSLFGNYSCKARNKLGAAKRTIQLLEGTKPDPPTSVNVRSVSAESVELEIKGPLGGDPETLGYKVQYRPKHGGMGWMTSQLSGESPYTILHLIPDMDYILQVATRNAAGYSDYVPEKSFKTTKLQADSVTGNNGGLNIKQPCVAAFIAILTVLNSL
uniref:Uncharacterized protein n=1 Tax=Timema genevievae TaxID=629358 RepID=A0A7R9JTC8_TIMGE|nr:unnamed protein product [Timema genevievae]